MRPEPRVERDLDVEAQLRPSTGRRHSLGGAARDGRRAKRDELRGKRARPDRTSRPSKLGSLWPVARTARPRSVRAPRQGERPFYGIVNTVSLAA